MPTLEYRNILDVVDGIIVHQVNPHVMGAGLALQIRRRFPAHYEDFKLWRKAQIADDPESALGTIFTTTEYAPLYIVGMCAQLEYGFAKRLYTRYDAFKECLKNVDYECLKRHKKLYIPYKIGCGLAGGEWGYILHFIKDTTPYAIVCKLGVPTNAEKGLLKRYGKIYL